MLVLLLAMALMTPAFAITEAEVEAQVSATSRETVTGNVLIWFLCAIGFLKVSQKIDSFMASLGVNVGQTGSSMLAEVIIATRGVAAIASSYGGGVRHAGGGSSGGAPSGPSGPFGGFLKGGLAGVVSRKVTSDAVRTATTATSTVNTVKSTAAEAAAQSRTIREQNADAVHQTDTQIGTHQETTTAAAHSASTEMLTQTAQQSEMSAAQIFQQSEHTARQTTTHTPAQASPTNTTDQQTHTQSIRSYLGYAGEGAQEKTPLTFSNVEIGGGRITGMVSRPDMPAPIAFGMYHADQYMEPKGDFSKIRTADGALWYTQLAQDTVERKPYKAPDDTVAYQESIVKRLPDPPKRKDRV